MTRDEKSALDLLIDSFNRFEERDERWKRDATRRLGAVEDFIVAEQALATARRERGLSWRWRVGVVLTAIGSVGGLVLALLK